MKTIFFAIFFSLFVSFGLTATLTWNSGVLTGNWNDPANWVPQGVPNSGDRCVIRNNQNHHVIVTTQANCGQIDGEGQFSITNGATLTVSNFSQTWPVTFFIEQGSTFDVNDFFFFNGNTVNFRNFGTVRLNPWVNGILNSNTITTVDTGNDVLFRGTRRYYFSQTASFPLGFQFSDGIVHSFESLSIFSPRTVTFDFPVNLPANGFLVQTTTGITAELRLVFNRGGNLRGGLTVTNSSSNRRPNCNFGGDFNVFGSLTFDCQPTFTGRTNFNGGTQVYFLNKVVTVTNSINSFVQLGGTTQVILDNNQGSTQTYTGNTPLVVTNPNLDFRGQWFFVGAPFTWNVTKVYATNTSLALTMVFNQQVTMSSGALFFPFGGTLTFSDNYVSNTFLNYTGIFPTLQCENNFQRIFNFTGSSPFELGGGFFVNNCTVMSSVDIAVRNNVQTVGNSTLPVRMTFRDRITFFANSSLSQSLYSITLQGSNYAVPTNLVYNINRVELIVTTGVFQVNTNGTIAGTGVFNPLGGISFSTGATVSVAVTAFNAGAQTLTSTGRVDWQGNILLRNAVLGGTADIWFTGALVGTKGNSSITNPNFKIKSNLLLAYLWDGNLPNTGATVYLGGGVTRVIPGFISMGTQINVVFMDPVQFNSTSQNDLFPGNSGAFTFMSSIQSIDNVRFFSGNYFFNTTDTRLRGPGQFTMLFNARLFVTGNINYPQENTDGAVLFSSTVNVYLINNVTFGRTVVVQSSLNTFDFDGDSSSTSVILTLDCVNTESRVIQSLYNLNTDLVINCNVIVETSSTLNDVGTLYVNGPNIYLENSITISNPFVWNATNPVLSSSGTQTLTVNTQTRSFSLPSGVTINTPATLQISNGNNIVLGASVSGTGQFISSNNVFVGTTAITINPFVTTLSNTTFQGSNIFNLNSQYLQTSSFFNAFVQVNINSNNVMISSSTTVTSSLVSFLANPLYLTGSSTLTFNVDYTVNAIWINNANLVFQRQVTLTNLASFNGTSSLVFQRALVLSRNLNVGNDVTFGFSSQEVVTLSGGVLSLTGNTVNVQGILVTTGGASVVCTSTPITNPVAISGGGVVDSSFTWSNSVQLGSLNVTGTRTFTFDVYLTNAQTTFFTDGVVLNGGNFKLLSSTDSPNLNVNNFIQTQVNTELHPNIDVNIYGNNGFDFQGVATLTLNGTFTSFTDVNFTSNVVFGWTSPSSSNDLVFSTGTTRWGPSTATLNIYRRTFRILNGVFVDILPTIHFRMSTTFTSFTGSLLTFRNNLHLYDSFSGNTNTRVQVDVITITSYKNSTISSLNLLGSLTFMSTTDPWIEPVLNLGTLSQTIILNGPVRMSNPTFTGNSGVNGPARLAITNGFTVQTNFVFGAPLQFYTTSPSTPFTINLSGSVSLPTVPSLFNPYSNELMDLVVSGSANSQNLVQFILSSTLVIRDLNVNGAGLRLTSGTFTARDVDVSGNARLWVDRATVNANTFTLNQNPNGNNPSIFQYTVGATPYPVVNAVRAVIEGQAVVNVMNSAWDGSAITILIAGATNSPTANFAAVYGTPGFTYTSARSGNSLTISRTANPTNGPSPTQSNGPSPAVSSSSFITTNIFLFAILFCSYFLF